MPRPSARPKIWLPRQMPKYGIVRSSTPLQQLDGVVGGGRVAGAVGHEHAVGLDGEHVVERRRGGQHVHLDAALGHAARRHALDAEVDRRHGEPLLADRRDDVRLGRS